MFILPTLHLGCFFLLRFFGQASVVESNVFLHSQTIELNSSELKNSKKERPHSFLLHFLVCCINVFVEESKGLKSNRAKTILLKFYCNDVICWSNGTFTSLPVCFAKFAFVSCGHFQN